VPDADDRPETDAAAATSAAAVDDSVEPLDVDGVGAILVGTIAWTVGLVVCLLLRDRLAGDGHAWWTWVCLAAALMGLPGLWFVRRRRAVYAAAKPGTGS
jgi:hypothetical protein